MVILIFNSLYYNFEVDTYFNTNIQLLLISTLHKIFIWNLHKMFVITQSTHFRFKIIIWNQSENIHAVVQLVVPKITILDSLNFHNFV